MRVYRASKPCQKVRLKYSPVEMLDSIQMDRGNMIPVIFACNVLHMHSYRHKTYRRCSVPIEVSGDTFNKAKQQPMACAFCFTKGMQENNHKQTWTINKK